MKTSVSRDFSKIFLSGGKKRVMTGKVSCPLRLCRLWSRENFLLRPDRGLKSKSEEVKADGGVLPAMRASGLQQPFSSLSW